LKPLSAPDNTKSTPASPSSPRVRILWASEIAELPAGFTASGYEPTGPAEELGRGGTFRMPWPDGRTVYYRKFRHGGLFGGIQGHRYWSQGRLTRELADSQRLAELGIRVPVPVLGRVERGLGGKRMAIVTQSIEGKTFFDVLKEGGLDSELLVEVGQTLAALHDTGFRHRDLHPANLLIDHDGKVHVLDLEGGSWGGQRGDSHAVTSLVRLARYWEKHGPDHVLPQIAWALSLLRGYEPDPKKRALLFQRCQVRYRKTVFWHRLFWRASPS
jgi:serine/threonine protein kinase